jgi:hypothetical protein
MSIKIANLAQDNLVELNATDSSLVVGGTGSTTVSVPAAPSVGGGSASTASISQIVAGNGIGAVSAQTATASGPGGNLANSSTGASLSGNTLSTNGGAIAINGVTPNVNVTLTGTFDRT